MNCFCTFEIDNLSAVMKADQIKQKWKILKIILNFRKS